MNKKLLSDKTLIKPDEYFFLYTSDINTTKRNQRREDELAEFWIDRDFTYYQNEFYKTISKKIPKSRIISTTGKDKEYVSRIIADTLQIFKLDDKYANR